MLPLLPIEYEDGCIDFFVGFPLWFRDSARDMLERIAFSRVRSASIEGWMRDLCKEAIVSNRRENGIDIDRLDDRTVQKLFFARGPGSMIWHVQKNDEYPVVPEYLLSGAKIDPSPLPIANILSLILEDEKAGPNASFILEMDNATALSTIYQLWVRREDPEQRENRQDEEYYQSEEFKNTTEGQSLESLYESEVNQAIQKANLRNANKKNRGSLGGRSGN